MTPTEQDKELREAIIGIVEAEYKMPNYIPAVERIDHIMQLITADRKRVALDALSGVQLCHRNTRTEIVSIVDGAILPIEKRIAELKAQ